VQERILSFVGILVLLGLAWAFSTDRRKVRPRVILWGLGLQFAFALLILKTEAGRFTFAALNDLILALLDCSQEGARFVFGNLTESVLPVVSDSATAERPSGLIVRTGSFFAFSVLPTIIFFSAFMAILYHLGVMQRVVSGIAWVMSRTMRTSGPESLSCAANIFVGQTEAPLVIRPYISTMSLSELHTVMVGGFATVAGGVMAAYVGFLHQEIPQIAGHLMAASIMSAPAAIVISKVLLPETAPVDHGKAMLAGGLDRNIIDAAARGALEGLTLALNVGAMLIAFLALVTLVNQLLGSLGTTLGLEELSLAYLFGKLFSPLAFVLGVPWQDCAEMGSLLGTKVMVNEFVAYLDLQALLAKGAITERTALIATYALCGFANVGSIGIQLGGIGGLAPERRQDLAGLGVRAMIAGAFASFSTACIAGILL